MKLRAPAYPLITVDPYFSLWSMSDKLPGATVRHWTGKPNTLIGTVTVDGEEKLFMGEGPLPLLEQTAVDVNAFSTTYTFTDGKIILTVKFTTPLLPHDLKIMTRPVGYVDLSWLPADGKQHSVTASLRASEELVMDKRGDDTVTTQVSVTEGGPVDFPIACMGREHQLILNRSGDDLRIEWGYLYVGAPGGETSAEKGADGMTYLRADTDMTESLAGLFLLGYDDVESIQYFGEPLRSVWNADGTSLPQAMKEAFMDHHPVTDVCGIFSDGLYLEAVRAGGVKYAELLSLAFRQVIAAHKCVLDKDGQVLFISKECFSNGCAATVDVSYPSIPLFLLYNPELIKGMMRPIFRFAASDGWKYDFAPHDAGRYPLVNGQVYLIDDPNGQMPVEECGNMLIMVTATAVAQKDPSFALEHWDTLSAWVRYLETYGEDPANQLCTDDFAGHLAHNCNLSLKAIMGVACFGLLNRMIGKAEDGDKYIGKARRMAESWTKRASNGDGSFRLAFDRPGTFSMKYNAVWDKLFGLNIFPAEVMQSEVMSNFAHMAPYGMPLDNRASYTKSDWLVWTATMCARDEDFERYVEPLWTAYHFSGSRVPMSDWYDTVTAQAIHFQNRTVQGGLFIKLLDASLILKQ